MAHYAFLDENNIVVEVIVGIDENETIEGLDPETWYSNFRGMTCKRTSYNRSIRKHYAGVGFKYDEKLDAFIPPKEHDSFIFDEESCSWIPPKPLPSLDKKYYWFEPNQEWIEAKRI